MILASSKQGHRPMTFEDLRGLRAEAYIRDSTLDQRDGFGPEIQRRNIERFAESYGLNLGNRWYMEFVSGRKANKRLQFQKFIEDAHESVAQSVRAAHGWWEASIHRWVRLPKPPDLQKRMGKQGISPASRQLLDRYGRA